MTHLKTAVLVPCYKRAEYTAKCLSALEDADVYPKGTLFLLVDDGSCDETANMLLRANLPKEVTIRDGNLGLRASYLEFFDRVRAGQFDLLGVIGNDCRVPTGWLTRMVQKFETTDADILCPNVSPSNAAYSYSREDTEGRGYRPAKAGGGLWFMRRWVIEGVHLDQVAKGGITGAVNVLQRLTLEQDPTVGWLPDLVVEDMGHWSGNHPDHVKSAEHRAYSAEVGRRVAW